MNGHNFIFDREEKTDSEILYKYKCIKCGQEINFNVEIFNLTSKDVPENIGNYVDPCEVEG